MIATCHWSATPPIRISEYHIEYALFKPLDDDFYQALLNAGSENTIDHDQLRSYFQVWKNHELTVATDRGTWNLNHDPRDSSPDIEIGALCMWNASTDSWGKYPFTIAHAWMAAHIFARVAQLKNIDIAGEIPLAGDPDVLQNGPVYNFATHAERAIQTYNPPVKGGGARDEASARKFGYFLNSGDPDLRWDLTILDPSQIPDLHTALAQGDARALAVQSGSWVRAQAHAIKAKGINDFWGLDA